MKEELKKLVKKTISSRKFMIGMPVLITLLCLGKISGEVFLAGFLALFAVNSYDKKARMDNGQSV